MERQRLNETTDIGHIYHCLTTLQPNLVPHFRGPLSVKMQFLLNSDQNKHEQTGHETAGARIRH